ncbi:MAG: phosphatidate cytidylyltransferase [Nitrospirae bacterium]|nr:phosphatidate cytidylyltransferase [Nitrospirota bacterium]MBF0535337.1 phosphatidate cytidylyltransferase [Nitrospirota bacterium]MBF0617240.1 phosphatidate cytidylyltransferase [Nitrospirota bacterium]
MHLKRLLVALVVVPALYLYIKYVPPLFFFVLIALISYLCLLEFLSMYKTNLLARHMFSLFGMIPVYLTYKYNDIPISAVIAVFLLISVIRLYGKKTADNAIFDLAPYWTGFFYIPFVLSYFVKLRAIGTELVISLLVIIWVADSFALYVGKAIGRRKLYETMSPNKTVEGAVAAIIGAVLSTLAMKAVYCFTIPAVKAVFIGVVLGIFGIIGDLVESMFKRDAGVKDSGVILPGHGGLLDKMDGMIFSAPVLYYLILYF